jgi:excisionase family DNA binding protein
MTEYLTIKEAAERVKVHRNTILAWIQQGMPCLKRGRVVRIRVEDLDSFLRKSEQEEQPKEQTEL